MRGMLCAALALAGAAGTVQAETRLPAGDALQRMVSGRTIVLDTPVGGVPIVYQANGTLAGKANGLQQAAGLKSDSGRWWIDNQKVCQQWNTWLEGRQYCYQMRFEGRLVHWTRSDGRTGTAKLVSQ